MKKLWPFNCTFEFFCYCYLLPAAVVVILKVLINDIQNMQNDVNMRLLAAGGGPVL